MIKYLTEEFDIKVSVKNVSDMAGIVTDITYNPAIVEPVDSDTGLNVINHAFLPGAILVTNNEIPGSVVAKLNMPSSPVTGSGDLFSIKFYGIGIGTTTITLTNHALYDISGEIPAIWQDETLDIIQIATVCVTINC
jgi:hypothetical protein